MGKGVYDRKKYDAKYYLTEKYKAKRKKYVEANKEKIKARMDFNNAVARGKITRLECCVCGAKNVQAHHNDYTKPYEVVWLCIKHHNEVHRKEK